MSQHMLLPQLEIGPEMDQPEQERKADFNRWITSRVNPMKTELSWIVNLGIVETCIRGGWIPHWKGLDTLATLRPISSFISKYLGLHAHELYRKFERGLVGPLPDAPRMIWR